MDHGRRHASDSVTAFAAAAARTHRFQLGTSIVPIYPRHPLMLATQAMVIAELAPDRLHLGIGPSHRPTVEGAFGIPFVKPLAYLREYVDVLRQYLWQGQVDVTGEFFTVHASLPQGMEPPRIPLLISALRRNAFHLAGEVADGAITWLCPVPIYSAPLCPRWKQALYPLGGPYLAGGPRPRGGTRRSRGSASRGALTARHVRQAAVLRSHVCRRGISGRHDGTLPDALLDELVVSGSTELILARLAEIRAAGAEQILAMPIPIEDRDAEENMLMRAIAGHSV